jgi:ribosomal protein S18 acetylase RimI-like enzyme
VTAAGLRVEPAGEERLSAVVSHVARAQVDPARHVAYVGVDIGSVSDELTDAEAWPDRLLVAFDGSELIGVLLADVDDDMRRVWWVGPWADSEDVAVALVSAGRDRFGTLFDEEELAPDSRNEMVRAAARRLGFEEGTASSVLFKLDPSADGVSSTTPLTADRARSVAELHDEIFAGTHTPGAKLVAAEGTRIRTAQIDGATAGYVAYEVQADGTGYIDYLGVRADVRRRGLGRLLVADVCRDLALDGVSEVHLTVRADAPGAVDLYRSLGFTEERVIVPCRYGFTLG